MAGNPGIFPLGSRDEFPIQSAAACTNAVIGIRADQPWSPETAVVAPLVAPGDTVHHVGAASPSPPSQASASTRSPSPTPTDSPAACCPAAAAAAAAVASSEAWDEAEAAKFKACSDKAAAGASAGPRIRRSVIKIQAKCTSKESKFKGEGDSVHADDQDRQDRQDRQDPDQIVEAPATGGLVPAGLAPDFSRDLCPPGPRPPPPAAGAGASVIRIRWYW